MSLALIRDAGVDRRMALASGAAILLAALLSYVNSFPGCFIQDDIAIVVNNPLVASLDLAKIFHGDYSGFGKNGGLYRPLTILSLGLNRLVFGEAAWGYHLVNVMLHGVAALLLWQMLRAWGIAPLVAWASALLFAVHPIHGEVVNLAVGRSELLVAVFLLFALWLGRKPSASAQVMLVACYLLALLSKEHAIVFLGLLPAMDCFHERFSIVVAKRWRLYGVLCLVTAVWLLWWQWGVPRLLQPNVYDPVYVPLAYAPADVRVLTALKLQGWYAAKLLLPFNLQAVYSGPDFPGFVISPWSWTGMAVVAAVVLLATLGYAGWRRREVWALSLMLYAIAFTPTSSIFFPIGVSFADRLAYLPSLWFCLGIASLLVVRQRWQRMLLGVLLVYAGLLGVLCVARNSAFASEAAYWRADLELNPNNPLAWFNLAVVLEERNPGLGEPTLAQMLKTMPDDAGTLLHWGLFLVNSGRFDEAIEPLSKTEQSWSNANDQRVGYVRGILAFTYLELGDFHSALHWLDRGARFYPNQDRILGWRGRALAGLGRPLEAVDVFARMAIIEPDSGIPFHYGMSLLQVGRLDEAVRWLRREVNEQESAGAWNGLGTALAGLNRSTEAADAFRRAVALAPSNQYYRRNLQRALAGVLPAVPPTRPE